MRLRGKLLIPLLLLLFVGAPAVVLVSLFGAPRAAALEGAQPGGEVEGFVRDARGDMLGGATVEAFLARWRTPGERPGLLRKPGKRIQPELELAAETVSAPDGSFVLTLPPHEGFYVLRARSATTIARDVEFSFLVGRGEVRAQPSVLLEVRSGARLTVRLNGDAVDVAAARGEWAIHSIPGSGFLRMPEPQRFGSGDFEGEPIVLESLPLCRVRVLLSLRGGRTFDEELDLQPGENAVDLEL